MAERQENEERDAQYKKDPSLYIAREEAMAQARQRMQEKHEQLSREYEERMKEKERKKQEEKLSAMESLVHGKRKSNNNSPSSLRPNYNPLMGSGGSSGYRPSRRGGPSGGG